MNKREWFFLPSIIMLAASCFLVGCASDAYLRAKGHSSFLSRNFESAAAEFAEAAKDSNANKLLFMLDEALSHFALGNFQKATEILLKAEDLAEIKDYTSISEEVGSLATSSNVKSYKGEDFEKVLINVYLALAFAAQSKIESAQVEARKINLLLYKMIHEGKRNYEESPFARYLAAMLWESSGEINSAYIDYKKTFELDPGFPGIGRDLLGTSAKLGFSDEYKIWTEKFPNESARKLSQNEGEVVVIFEQGLSPVKIPRNGQDSSLPRFIRRRSPYQAARIKVNGIQTEINSVVLDIEATSIRYLEDRISRMAAAKVAGLAVKGALAAGLGKATDNSDLGWIAFYALALSDRADLRSWRTLPASLMMKRMSLAAGTYDIDLEILDGSGNVLGTRNFGKVQVKPKKKVFIVGR